MWVDTIVNHIVTKTILPRFHMHQIFFLILNKILLFANFDVQVSQE
jgi:hypothetical protein